MDKEYIGDGVYVGNDDYAVILMTEREHGVDVIYLEPFVAEALVKYIARFRGE
jgi:hypothetical protein